MNSLSGRKFVTSGDIQTSNSVNLLRDHNTRIPSIYSNSSISSKKLYLINNMLGRLKSYDFLDARDY